MSAAREGTPELPQPSGTGLGAVVGQNVVLRALGQAIERARLPHALLFSGPEGVGKATTALLLAQALNCRVAGPRDACGTCTSCSKIARGIHPDFYWLAPTPRNIKIAQVREVIGAAGYRPHEGLRRVVVIDGAHTMQGAAQNAFLKTLEEPPPSTSIILVTHAPGTLLPTVRSRCQTLRFSPVGQEAVRAYLEQQMDMPPAEARLRAALTPGSIGSALALDIEAYGSLLDTVVEALRLSQGGGGGVVAAADSLANAGHGEVATQRAASTLRIGRDVLRDLLVVTTQANADLVNAEQREAWLAWSAEVTSDGVVEALRALNVGIERFTTGITPNIKMALEQTLVEVGRALAGVPGRTSA
jgi:DNA polymerase-3 subunit delta'